MGERVKIYNFRFIEESSWKMAFASQVRTKKRETCTFRFNDRNMILCYLIEIILNVNKNYENINKNILISLDILMKY